MRHKPDIRIKLKKNQAQAIYVVGDRDPRGADNRIDVWLDEEDRLHISVLKAQRCYRFAEMCEYSGHIELIQV